MDWLIKRGKKSMLYYDKDQLRRIREYFDQLDVEKCGFISLDQIEEVLTSFGLIENSL